MGGISDIDTCLLNTYKSTEYSEMNIKFNLFIDIQSNFSFISHSKNIDDDQNKNEIRQDRFVKNTGMTL